MTLNVLSNLMAMLSPKAAAKAGAHPSVPDGATPDFAAMLGSGITDTVPLATDLSKMALPGDATALSLPDGDMTAEVIDGEPISLDMMPLPARLTTPAALPAALPKVARGGVVPVLTEGGQGQGDVEETIQIGDSAMPDDDARVVQGTEPGMGPDAAPDSGAAPQVPVPMVLPLPDAPVVAAATMPMPADDSVAMVRATVRMTGQPGPAPLPHGRDEPMPTAAVSVPLPRVPVSSDAVSEIAAHVPAPLPQAPGAPGAPSSGGPAPASLPQTPDVDSAAIVKAMASPPAAVPIPPSAVVAAPTPPSSPARSPSSSPSLAPSLASDAVEAMIPVGVQAAQTTSVNTAPSVPVGTTPSVPAAQAAAVAPDPAATSGSPSDRTSVTVGDTPRRGTPVRSVAPERQAENASIPVAVTDSEAPPAIGEATALLRLIAGKAPASRPVRASVSPAVAAASPRLAAAPADVTIKPATARIDAAPVIDATTASDPAHNPAQATAQTPVASQATPVVAPAPVTAFSASPTPALVDLSASLGQSVIDMSSGGQWIDGLAREIATLSTGAGQGTFRLSPEHLGPMRVDIRNGDLGAEISLTVQTEAAETALRQDSDRLKADGQLSAIRVSDVRVERVHHVAEPSRSDTANGQSTNSNSGWTQGGTQAGLSQGQGQNQAQNQGQNAPQTGGQHIGRKPSSGDAVLNHAAPADRAVDDGQSGLRRARYA